MYWTYGFVVVWLIFKIVIFVYFFKKIMGSIEQIRVEDKKVWKIEVLKVILIYGTYIWWIVNYLIWIKYFILSFKYTMHALLAVNILLIVWLTLNLSGLLNALANDKQVYTL
jgi:hypothetical protein